MTLLTSSLAGKGAEKTKKKIWDCLMDVNVGVFGVCGMGGVGKTTIMKHVYNQLIEDSDFDSVIWVTVSRNSTLVELQSNILKCMGIFVPLHVDDETRGSMEVYSALKRRKKFVLILDDMDRFYVQDIGIPRPDQENGCKLVITSRSLNVCYGMGSRRVIKVEVFREDDAWELFKDVVAHDFSPDEKAIAKLILKECSGLPLAITTIGRRMGMKKDIQMWHNLLHVLKGSKTEIQCMKDDVFSSLKLSYDKLRDKTLQDCFLYCALYPKDFEIPQNNLIECLRGEEIIELREDSEAEMIKGYVILDDLQRACILEGLPNIAYGECIKMHDLIRDMAIDITRVHPLFVVRAGVGLEVAPKEEEWFKDVERISLMGNKIEMLSGEHVCPNLSTLFLQGNWYLKVIHDTFFKHMQSLRVLDISNTAIKSLPESVSNLENLRVLLLHGCLQLRKLPTLAKLKKLRVLDLGYAPLDELPQGLEALTKLRCLRLSTNKLQSFPPGIFSELSNLEELKMYGGHWRWSSRAITFGAKIEELTSLTRLADLTIHIEDLQTFVGFVSSRNWQAMKSFQLLVGSLSEFLPPPGNFVALYRCDLESEHLVIPDNTSALDIDECRIFCLSHLSCLSNAGKLKECFIKRCDEMEYVLMGNERTLSCLETLDLFSLPKLHALYKGVVSHGTLVNMKKLYIKRCNSLKNLFSLEFLQQLRKLEKIEVSDCNLMEEIIEEEKAVSENKDDNTYVTIPNLKELILHDLRVLRSICKRAIICSSLNKISIRQCPKLRNLPFSTINIKPVLKEIRGEKEWWDALQWDDANAKALFQPHFIDFAQRR